MAEVTLENVTKVYGEDVVAVQDMNLDIPDGEFVVFVGPSGCGKSTALRMIAGLEDISGGKVFIADDVVNDLPPRDRDIAMVFQNYALYPHMNVRENMGFALKLKKFDKDEIERRVEEAAKVLSIEHFLDRKPKALSGGQSQRVALGRAIVREPSAFLMDEPPSNLDAKLRVQMRTEIAKLHNRIGTTTIYVTHDQTEAMTMADRIVVLKDGLVQQVDHPQDMYDHPKERLCSRLHRISCDELHPGQARKRRLRRRLRGDLWQHPFAGKQTSHEKKPKKRVVIPSSTPAKKSC